MHIRGILKDSIAKFNILPPPSFRYGKVFNKFYTLLNESQWWSEEKHFNYQSERLSDLIKHVYEYVPYYRKLFKHHNIVPANIKDPLDLERIPFLTKDIILSENAKLISTNLTKSSLEYLSTGGSTGIPVGFYIEKKKTRAIEKAFICRKNYWIKCDINDQRIVLEAHVKGPMGSKGLWARHGNCLSISYTQLNNSNALEYYNTIAEFQPSIIHGYPSALYMLASHLKTFDCKSLVKNGISSSSEMLYLFQRKLIEKVFNCKVFDLYGQTEMVSAAAECEKHEGYHLFSEYSITELIDSSGKPISKPGEVGRIVGTGFNNYAMPFIRYKTDDLAVFSSSWCSCGRKLPLIEKIEGRLQEVIVTKDDKLISMTSVNMHDNTFDNVKQFQFIQEKKGHITLTLIKNIKYSQKDTKQITTNIQQIIGKDFDLELKFVSNIPLTTIGKHRFLIQQLKVRM